MSDSQRFQDFDAWRNDSIIRDHDLPVKGILRSEFETRQ